MRAPVQKKRPRGKGGTPGTATPATPTGTPQANEAATNPGHTPDPGLTPGGRPVRVRRRLVAGVALVSLTVLAAGAPALLTASGELTESQRLVTLAELNRQAVTLAHSLADERDEVTAYIAAGREDQSGPKKDRRTISDSRSARVDRQIDEIGANVPAANVELLRDLDSVPSVRRTALSGKGTALDAYKAYTDIIAGLHALADELAEKTPARAAEASRAPAALGLAVEQASASRALLLAALSVPAPEEDEGPSFDPVTGLPVEDEDKNKGKEEAEAARGALSAAAQQARVRELAALADFDQAASGEARDKLAATVTGPDVKTAEGYLARLTDQPELSKSDLKSNRAKVESALSARVEQMRGVESALVSAQVERLEQLRDDDVTGLELRAALLGGCLLITIGISAAVARTLTRPLAVLRIGAARLAADPEAEEPIRFTGRNDEFAQVVRSLNTVHGKLLDLAARTEELDAVRSDASAARAELAAQRTELQARTAEVSEQLERLRKTVSHTFVNLSLRTLGLVERQLAIIENLEEREQDPERLSTLFKLDHLATVMRRHSENLLVLAGSEHGHAHVGPVPLVDVMRAAVSEIERYERVTIQSLPPHAQVAGFAADDLSHLVAELLENATSFSPPDAQVQLSGWLLESGEVMLSVQDEGIGMTEGRLEELNAKLADPEPGDTDFGIDGEGLGLRVAALLARRHGVRVQLREQKQGGLAAVVVLPQSLLPTAPPAVPAQSTPALTLPGSVAEANSNTLPGRAAAAHDPLIAAAEHALEASEGDAGTEAPSAATPATDEPSTRAADAESEAEATGPDAEPAAAVTDRDPEPATDADAAPDAEYAAAADTAPAANEDTSTPTAQAPVVDTDDESAADTAPVEVPSADADAAPDADADPGPDHAPAPDVTPATTADTATAAAPAADADADPDADAPRPEGSGPEVTLQVRIPRPAPEPDAHERVADGGDVQAAPAADAVDGDADEPVTDKGLPKRTPKIVAPPAAPKARAKSVDAEALRRRLGGFHQGAKDGRRDVESELAEAGPGTGTGTGTGTTRNQEHREDSGDTVEEARS
ncbi:nitrate- and nitrite sensing domain-containing protein [Streptomyces sp. NPDC000410]|uniref:sensor histidine kinase n=1 Tax=Streptomyces sp. NPDC000410 TaxID=3154254 RepID=UPI0033279095